MGIGRHAPENWMRVTGWSLFAIGTLFIPYVPGISWAGSARKKSEGGGPSPSSAGLSSESVRGCTDWARFR